MSDIYIYDAVRTPRGRGKANKGALSGLHPQELFAQALIDEIEEAKELRRQHALGLAYGVSEYIPLADFESWSRPRLAEAERLAQAVSTLINETLQVAFGPPGKPGSVELIVFVARNVGKIYREAIEWSLRVRRSAGDERLAPVTNAMVDFTRDMIEKIESFGSDFLAQIDSALAAPDTAKPITISMTLQIEVPHSTLEKFEEAIRQVEKQLL